jgi:hypothetical protein
MPGPERSRQAARRRFPVFICDAGSLEEGPYSPRRLFLLLCDISPDGQITRRRV